MANKYNSRISLMSGIPNITYTLALGAGGAAATPIVLANSGSGTPWPTTVLRAISGGNSANTDFQVNDQVILKSFGVFCNFADGLVWDDGDGPPTFMIQLVDAAVPSISITRGNIIRLESFNTMYPFDMVLDTYATRSLTTTGDWSVAVGRPTGPCDEVTFYTNGISTVWDTRVVRFAIRAEVEHTFVTN